MVCICRLCGKYDFELLGIQIYSEEGLNKALAYKIKLSLDISVYEYDPLPKYICKVCIEKLFTTFAFQENCRKTQIELRERLLATESYFLSPIFQPHSIHTCIHQSFLDLSLSFSIPTLKPSFASFWDSYWAFSATVVVMGKLVPTQNGTVVSTESEKQSNNVLSEILPKVVNVDAVQNPVPADARTLTLNGQPFEFNTLMRNGLLDNIAKVMNNKNSQKIKSKNAKKTKQTNNRRKQQHLNNISEAVAVESSQDNVEASEQPIIQLPNNTVSCSSSTLEVANVAVTLLQDGLVTSGQPAIVSTAQLSQDIVMTSSESKPVNIVNVNSVQNSSRTTTTIDNIAVNSSNPRNSVILGPQAMSDKLQSPLNIIASTTSRTWHTPSKTMTESSSCIENVTKPSENESRINDTSNLTANDSRFIFPSQSTVANSTSNSTIESSTMNTTSTLDSTTLKSESKDQDDIFIVEVVKANKSVIAKYLEKCPEDVKNTASVEQQDAAGTERIRASLRSLPVYELHKRLVNDYILCRQGATSLLQRDTSRDRRDIDVIRDNLRFLWDEEDTPDSWEARLAKKYYDKLFKEYAICDLSRYKENK
ncbi:hypothetical protein L9F63_013403, partial [Diploptera punctata]